MTHSSSQPSIDPSAPVAGRIGVPGASAALFISAIPLIVIGFFVLMGTSSRRFFEHAPGQAALGTAAIALGVLCLLCTFLLVGVRQIVQHQTDILLQTERERGGSGE